VPIETSFPPCFDPYLQYMLGEHEAMRSFLETRDKNELPLSLLVRLKEHVKAEQFRQRVQEIDPDGQVHVGPAEDPVPYLTVRIGRELAMTRGWRTLWEETASDISLSVPVDSPPKSSAVQVAYDRHRPKSSAKTIIGILDDGCAFAHHRLLSRNLKSSRVLAIWDQEPGRTRTALPTTPQRVFGRTPLDFKHGLEFWRVVPGLSPTQEIGIDEWIGMHLTPAGSVDEDYCYDHAGFQSLRRRETHGSHVTDVLAGWVPTSARVSMDTKTPPSFTSDPDSRWDDTDIVFVQIPRKAVEDASGQWLRTQVVDGLRYILSCAGGSTDRVVFNMSYGTTTGPHDGTAALEEFLSLMAKVFDGNLLRPRLEVLLPAGNSRRSACHVTFKSTQAGTTQWVWRVPADNTVPVMAEVRVRNSQAAHVTDFKLDPPAAYAGRQAKVRQRIGLRDTRWALVVPPTRVDTEPLKTTAAGDGPAMHGDWTISLTVSHPHVEVHAYVARTDPNMGARPGAKQSRFIDPAWEFAAAAATSQTPEGRSAATDTLVSASGTLSGIATACRKGVYVAAGYTIASQRSSHYSSPGPSRGAREGPDYALPTDENQALAGIPGAGTRSGCVFRLVGTSTASPQLARLLLRAPPPIPCPEGGPPANPESGCGMLKPP
jgi:hypothetical protein